MLADAGSVHIHGLIHNKKLHPINHHIHLNPRVRMHPCEYKYELYNILKFRNKKLKVSINLESNCIYII